MRPPSGRRKWHTVSVSDLLPADEEIREALADLPGWRFERGEIFKQYKFATFMDAVAFIDRLAEAAEEANHHPDLDIRYNKVRLALISHDSGGITKRDIKMAERLAHEPL